MTESMMWTCIIATIALVLVAVLCVIPFIFDMWVEMFDELKDRKK